MGVEVDRREGSSPRTRPRTWSRSSWLLLGILGAGLGLRAGGLVGYWINADEGLYYDLSHLSLDTLRAGIALNSHPPLFYWLLRGAAWLGQDPLWLRLPSLVFGCLAIVAAHRLGCVLRGPGTGLVAAALVALSPGAIVLSQVARPYMLQVWILLACLHRLCRYRVGGRSRDLWGYSGFLLAAVLVHYSSFQVVAGLGLVVLGEAALGRLPRRQITPLALAHVPAVMAGAFLYVFHIRARLMEGAVQRDAVTGYLGGLFIEGPSDAWTAYLGVMEYLAGAHLGLSVALALPLAAIVFARNRGAFVPLVGACTFVVALGLSALELYPVGASRHSVYFLPFAAATLAGAASIAMERGPRAWGAVLVGLALLVGLANLMPREAFSPWLGPPRELLVSMADGEIFAEHVRTLRDEPGLMILDAETAFILAPVLIDARRQYRYIGRPPLVSYQWGRRTVVVTNSWVLGVGKTGRESPKHLASLLPRLAEEIPALGALDALDVRLLSVRSGGLSGAMLELEGRYGPVVFRDAVWLEPFGSVRLLPEVYLRAVWRGSGSPGDSEGVGVSGVESSSLGELP